MEINNTRNILDWLENKGLLKERNQAQSFILSQTSADKLPISTQVLMGIGSFIGFFCIFSLLFASKIIDYDKGDQLLITGIIAMFFSLICYYGLRDKMPFLHSIGIQCALMLMLAGKLLFVIGFGKLTAHYFLPLQSQWMITLGLFIVTVPMYFIFPLQLDRFLFCLFSLGSILVNTLNYNTNLALFNYFVPLVFFTFLLFMWRKKSPAWSPLAYAFAITLCLSALHISIYEDLFRVTSNLIISTKYFNLVLGIGLIFICFILGKGEQKIQLPMLCVFIGIGILTYITNTGILASLALLILGKAKYERPLLILGSVFLCFFIIEYYYTLRYPLHFKAGILATTGIVMLLGSLIIKTMNWHRKAS